LIMGLAR